MKKYKKINKCLKWKMFFIPLFIILIAVTLLMIKNNFNMALVTVLSIEDGQVYIPSSTVVNQGFENRSFVWVIKEQFAKLNEIKISEYTDDGMVKVVKGLERGDKLILYSSKALHEGVYVKERNIKPILFGKDKCDFVGKDNYTGASGEKDIHIQLILKKNIDVSGYKIATEDNQKWEYPYNGADWIIYPERKGVVVDLYFEPKTPFVYNLYAVMVEYDDGSTQLEFIK